MPSPTKSSTTRLTTSRAYLAHLGRAARLTLSHRWAQFVNQTPQLVLTDLMSRYEWEGGTLTLPTAAVSPVRNALTDAANKHHDAVLAECLRLWNGPIAKTSSAKLYRERLNAALMSSRLTEPVSDAVGYVMEEITSTYRGGNGNPRTPRASDVEIAAPRANSRSTTFSGGEWSIQIDGAKLTYRTGDNNHAIDHARAHPVVTAMFRVLAGTNWTRATGGVFAGNDEYNRESRDSGSGSNYITEAFGPLGEGEKAAQMGISLERYRKLLGGRR